MVRKRRAPALRSDNAWLWFGGTWLATGLLFLAIGIAAGWHEVFHEWPLQRDGVIARGVVLDKQMGGGSGGEPGYEVRYRFALPGSPPVEGIAQVDGEAWDRMAKDRPVRVLVVPESPLIHRIEGSIASDRRVLAAIVTALGAILSSLGGLITGRALMQRRAGRSVSIARGRAAASGSGRRNEDDR